MKYIENIFKNMNLKRFRISNGHYDNAGQTRALDRCRS